MGLGIGPGGLYPCPNRVFKVHAKKLSNLDGDQQVKPQAQEGILSLWLWLEGVSEFRGQEVGWFWEEVSFPEPRRAPRD